MDKSVISSKYFHALLNCNDTLHFMAARHFAIRIALIIQFHSTKRISVDDECVWENDNGVKPDVSPAIHKLWLVNRHGYAAVLPDF
jgi:hypothetical protein